MRIAMSRYGGTASRFFADAEAGTLISCVRIAIVSVLPAFARLSPGSGTYIAVWFVGAIPSSTLAVTFRDLVKSGPGAP